jgi:hypothetical protein
MGKSDTAASAIISPFFIFIAPKLMGS